MWDGSPFDVTFRGVEVTDEVIGYIRSRVRRLGAHGDIPVSVVVERGRPGGVVRAIARTTRGQGAGEDVDELLALRDAFATLSDQVLVGCVATATEPTAGRRASGLGRRTPIRPR